MKKIILMALALVPSLSFGQNWLTAGNSLGATGLLGSTSAQAVSMITNNTERINISSGGTIKFTGMTGTSSGLMILSSNGTLSRLDYTSGGRVLTGDGAWTNYSTLSGWNPGIGLMYTTQKVGIGVTSPAQALEVSGNIIASGSVSASSFDVGSVATVQGHLNISNSVIHKAYDATAGTRNEVYTTDHEYYINSNTSYNYNTILSQGNTSKVGIGTSSPSAKLHVVGGTKLDGGTTVDSLTFGTGFTLKSKTMTGITGIGFSLPSTSIGAFGFPSCISKGTGSVVLGIPGFFESYSSTASGSVVMGHNGSMGLIDSYSSNAAYADLMLNYSCGYNVGICTGTSGGNVYMTTSSTGKVGVGTNTPTDKVEIKTGYFSTHIGNADFSGLGYGTTYLGFNAARTSGGTWKTDADGSHNGGAVIYGDVLGDIYFSTVGSTGTTGQTGIADATVKSNARLFINGSNGHIGIGTTCTPYALTVEGHIGSREMWVKTDSWCDYVFASDYKLMPLAQVEAYIKANGHLPGIPSAEEVIEKGEFSLGEVSKQHLEKIEELTRYMIEMNKRLEQLEKENAELKAQINNK